VIAWDEELPSQPVGHAAVTVALADGEAEAYFAPAHGFTIWADDVVDRTIRAPGRDRLRRHRRSGASARDLG
jgi:hypothetical protein